MSSSPTQRQSEWLTVALLAMVAFPATLTLLRVQVPGNLLIPSENPTPLGYTVSLSLFIVPIVVIAGWFLPHEGVEVPRRAFWWTIGILFPLGAALDFFFAHAFFLFPNKGATLGIEAPALGKPVPIEEYIFYLTGFIAVLLIYIWLDEYWLRAYSVAIQQGHRRKLSALVQFHPASLIVGLVLIIAGFLFKKLLSGDPTGFSGYFTFIIALAFIPSAGFLPTARPYINWRAFTVTFFFILLVSLIWEATLAAPYGWWRYQSDQMVGVFIGAWHGLPIEAVLVWLSVTYSTAIVFVIVKLWQAGPVSAAP